MNTQQVHSLPELKPIETVLHVKFDDYLQAEAATAEAKVEKAIKVEAFAQSETLNDKLLLCQLLLRHATKADLVDIQAAGDHIALAAQLLRRVAVRPSQLEG